MHVLSERIEPGKATYFKINCMIFWKRQIYGNNKTTTTTKQTSNNNNNNKYQWLSVVKWKER